MSLTVTETALIDFQKQKDAIMARAKNFDPVAAAESVCALQAAGLSAIAAQRQSTGFARQTCSGIPHPTCPTCRPMQGVPRY